MSGKHDRRFFLRQAAWATSAVATTGLVSSAAFADQLALTPRQTEGPFYPDKLPLDTDNDLLILNDKLTPAVGQVTHLTGRVLTASGQPVRNAVVEIWQADAHGVYLHSGSQNKDKQDANFQGFGRFLTGMKGEYYFRTIKPVPYFPRTPHIHFAVNQGDKRLLTTQCYIKGHPGNERDGVLRQMRDAEARERLMVAFRPLEGSQIGELVAHFDIVVGATPEDPSEDRRRELDRGQ